MKQLGITKSLIIKKHWLDKILSGEKTWEMRTTRTKTRGKIGLIESGSGLIVATIEITGCSIGKVTKNPELIKYHQVEDLNLLDKWCYAWYMRKPNKLKKPIPYDHPKGAVIWVKHD